MNGRPSRAAKYASDTAVEPDEASMTVVFSPIQPLHSAYRNNDRASRCLRLPVMWVDSSLRYSWTSHPSHHAAGNGYRSRCVSALRRASASINRTALSTHERGRARLAVEALSVTARKRSGG